MKQFVVTLLAVLVGGFLALLAYDRLVVQPRAAASAPAAPGQLAPAPSAAPDAATPTPASMPAPVAAAAADEAAAAPPMSDNERAALIMDAVRRATMFRVALTEYHQTNGRWPRDADEAGLPASEETRGGAVQGIELGPRGTVTVRLDPRFGRDGAIVLTPDAQGATGALDWRCEVRGDAALRKALPRCG